jgi:hypothetical protein
MVLIGPSHRQDDRDGHGRGRVGGAGAGQPGGGRGPEERHEVRAGQALPEYLRGGALHFEICDDFYNFKHSQAFKCRAERCPVGSSRARVVVGCSWSRERCRALM